ncbi:HAD family hydrolase [Deltaproteobacteria bacterium TL4]
MDNNWLSYNLFLFDLDDTLINTRDSVRQACLTALNQVPSLLCYQAEGRVDELLSTFIKHFGTTADREYWRAFIIELLHEHPVTDPYSIADNLCEIYRKEYWNQLKPLNDDCMAFIQYLINNNKSMALITNGTLKFQRKKLVHTNLSQFFSHIFCSDQFPPQFQKPSPYMIIQAIQCFQGNPKETVFFGNSIIDVIAGNLAGVHTVAINEIMNPEHIHLLTPYFIYTSWHSIIH